MNMKQWFFILALGTSFTLSAQSDRFKKKGSTSNSPTRQEQPATEPSQTTEEPGPETFWDRVIFGGGGGLNFGNNTNIFLAPQLGYKVTDNWIAGIGYMYNYTRWTQILTLNGVVEVDFENQVHGPNVFTTFTFFESLFAGAQAEILNHDAYIYNSFQGTFDVENRWTPVLFVQGGFYQPIGSKGMMQIGLRLNLLHDEFSPYATSWTPIIQLYF